MPHQVDISHPDKVLYPKLNLTKQDVVDFYQEISEYLLPHLKDRPLVVQRFTEGVNEKGFYQQEVPDYYPDWMSSFEVQRREKGKQMMLEVHTKSALKYVVNQDGICFHTWLSHKDRIDQPDLMVYDLDPPGGDFSSVKKAARIIGDFMKNLGSEPFVMTTGSKGLHVVVPIRPEKPFDEVREAAKKIASQLVEENPDLFTIEVRKNKREGKIFLDYLRNSFGQTTISPYSLREGEVAPVATPLDWDELSDNNLQSQRYHVKNILKRLSQKKDPWRAIAKHRCSLETLLI